MIELPDNTKRHTWLIFVKNNFYHLTLSMCFDWEITNFSLVFRVRFHLEIDRSWSHIVYNEPGPAWCPAACLCWWLAAAPAPAHWSTHPPGAAAQSPGLTRGNQRSSCRDKTLSPVVKCTMLVRDSLDFLVTSTSRLTSHSFLQVAMVSFTLPFFIFTIKTLLFIVRP